MSSLRGQIWFIEAFSIQPNHYFTDQIKSKHLIRLIKIKYLYVFTWHVGAQTDIYRGMNKKLSLLGYMSIRVIL